MKVSRIVTTLFGASLLFAVGALAQERGTLKIDQPIKVQGTELKPGKYNVQWEGSGSTVQVSILKGKENIVTVPATVVTKATSNSNGGYGSRTEADGSHSLFAIYPEGKKVELEIGQKQASN